VGGFGAGDFNADGKIDGGDLALWQQNYDPLGVAHRAATSPRIAEAGTLGAWQAPVEQAPVGVDDEAFAQDASEHSVPSALQATRERIILADSTAIERVSVPREVQQDVIETRAINGKGSRVFGFSTSGTGDLVDILELTVLGTVF
jgi:hypothetical protein